PPTPPPAPNPRSPCLNPTDRRIQRADHAQPVTQLADHSQARVRRQRRIRRTGPHPLTRQAAATYPAHQIGVLSTGPIITWQRSSSQARAAPIAVYALLSPPFSRVGASPGSTGAPEVGRGWQGMQADSPQPVNFGWQNRRAGGQSTTVYGCKRAKLINR